MKPSVNYVYLICENCKFGKKKLWKMPAGTYYNGGFINRKCPNCGFIDVFNPMPIDGQKVTRKIKISVSGIDY